MWRSRWLFGFLFFSSFALSEYSDSYVMTIYRRNPLVLFGITHHDYQFRKIGADGTVEGFEMNWGIRKIDWRHPLQGVFGKSEGKMQTVADSDAHAQRHIVFTREFTVPITAAAYYSAQGNYQRMVTGQVTYTAVGSSDPNSLNCIRSGIPPIVGPISPGVGPFAARRIINTMNNRGFIPR